MKKVDRFGPLNSNGLHPKITTELSSRGFNDIETPTHESCHGHEEERGGESNEELEEPRMINGKDKIKMFIKGFKIESGKASACQMDASQTEVGPTLAP